MPLHDTRLQTLLDIPALTHRGEMMTKARDEIRAIDGTLLASLSHSPELLIAQALQEQRRTPPLPMQERANKLRDAADMFLHDKIHGISFTEHCELVRMISGHSRKVATESSTAVAQAISDAPNRADQGRPIGSVRSAADVRPGTENGVWTRRGQTLGAVLSGNSPLIQNGWLQALALGYRVTVRPSSREPFTAYRVIGALRAAGFRSEDAVYLPTGHEGGTAILRRADFGFAYGGDELVDAYANSPTIKVHGPGRTKVLLDGEDVTSDIIEQLAHSVAAASGTGCVNTTAIFVRGDHFEVAKRLADELREQSQAAQAEIGHLGPRVSSATHQQLQNYLNQQLGNAHPIIPFDDIAKAHEEGGVVMGPAVFTTRAPSDPALNTELPFPCVWIAPWTPHDGAEVFGHSLIVNAITDDAELIEALDRDETIRNLYVSVTTVHSSGMIPHEGFVGDFLMRNRAVVRGV